MADKPSTDINLIIKWADKAKTNCEMQGRKEAALLWHDCLEYLLYFKEQVEELKQHAVCDCEGCRAIDDLD